jgi:hypothetical protein
MCGWLEIRQNHLLVMMSNNSLEIWMICQETSDELMQDAACTRHPAIQLLHKLCIHTGNPE